MLDTEKVTRIEVIENAKRMYVKWDCIPAFSLQDGGRTLKIFIDGEKIKKELDKVAVEVDVENLRALRKILDKKIKELEDKGE